MVGGYYFNITTLCFSVITLKHAFSRQETNNNEGQKNISIPNFDLYRVLLKKAND